MSYLRFWGCHYKSVVKISYTKWRIFEFISGIFRIADLKSVLIFISTSHQLLLQLFLIIGSTIFYFGIFIANLSSSSKTYTSLKVNITKLGFRSAKLNSSF